MRVLLDTHAFLWFVLDEPALSAVAKATIEDASNDVLVSPASFWEIAIKVSIGKYELKVPFETFWERGMGDNVPSPPDRSAPRRAAIEDAISSSGSLRSPDDCSIHRGKAGVG